MREKVEKTGYKKFCLYMIQVWFVYCLSVCPCFGKLWKTFERMDIFWQNFLGLQLVWLTYGWVVPVPSPHYVGLGLPPVLFPGVYLLCGCWSSRKAFDEPNNNVGAEFFILEQKPDMLVMRAQNWTIFFIKYTPLKLNFKRHFFWFEAPLGYLGDFLGKMKFFDLDNFS